MLSRRFALRPAATVAAIGELDAGPTMFFAVGDVLFAVVAALIAREKGIPGNSAE